MDIKEALNLGMSSRVTLFARFDFTQTTNTHFKSTLQYSKHVQHLLNALHLFRLRY